MRFLNILLVLFCVFLSGCQSGCFSRFGGASAKLPLPNDFAEPIGFARGESTKHLFYKSTDGKLKVREYSDMGILEAEYEFVK